MSTEQADISKAVDNKARKAAYAKAYREKNGDKLRAYSAEWKLRNREKRAAYLVRTAAERAQQGEQWYEKNRERKSASSAAWYAANKERRRAAALAWARANPEVVARKTVKYRKAHWGKVLARASARHAAKLKRTPPWADLPAIEMIYQAASIARITLNVPIDVDHDIPLQGETVSGLHVHNNLRLLLSSENRKKSNRFQQVQA